MLSFPIFLIHPQTLLASRLTFLKVLTAVSDAVKVSKIFIFIPNAFTKKIAKRDKIHTKHILFFNFWEKYMVIYKITKVIVGIEIMKYSN